MHPFSDDLGITYGNPKTDIIWKNMNNNQGGIEKAGTQK